MYTISEMFERLNLNVLAVFLQHGTSETELLSTGTCEQRLEKAEKEFREQFAALGLDPQLSEDITNVFYSYQGETIDAFLELGMRAGVTLYRNLVEGIPADAQTVIDKAVG